MGSCLLNFLLVRVKLLIWWDFCRFFKVLLEQLLKFLLIHFYDTFYNESIKLLGRMVRCRINVLYHLLDKIGKEPNADLFQFMKGPSHQ